MGDSVKGIKFWLVFIIATLNINLAQILCYPVRFYNAQLYASIIDYSKASFSKFLVILLNLQGRKSVQQSVIISNHLLYTDWIYIWTLLYKLNTNADKLIIILKHSLKHIPILGWGMQFFNFIFLRRSWSTDNKVLTNQLQSISNDPFTLLLFPEGTTLSNESRPKSVKFTQKIGTQDFKHLLYPRVTGLLHSLRSLSHNPKLQVVDATLAYPGIPEGVYGQDWYTLKNTFLKSVAPDMIHVHLSSWSLSDIPIDDEDKFTQWLLQRWQEKEQRLDLFHKTRTLQSGGEFKDIPIGLSDPLSHTLDAFIYFIPITIVYIICRILI
ncbi:hypothetical protein E3P99_01925 [Wallemia hederae]|uniref:Phospholipid/glycerol acyltransferase domain-containing protein n=1 Tax=Wallemia hederae TaxID=1540922 RepID=A0A4T0FN36_9BASI|nr:hypothetical protein E3P99_01925 [Wallemia hederae]